MHTDLLFIPIAYLIAYLIHRPHPLRMTQKPVQPKKVTHAILLDRDGNEVSKKAASSAEKFIYKQHGAGLIDVYQLLKVEHGMAYYKEQV